MNLGKKDTDEVGQNVGETGRPLLSADELRQLPATKQLLLVKSLPPIKSDRIAFWDVSPWNMWAALNPVEGAHPLCPPKFTLGYKAKGGSDA